LWLTAWASIESQHRRVVDIDQGQDSGQIGPCGFKPTRAKGFLRIVFYSRRPWRLKVDPTKHRYESSFEPREKVIKPAAWKMAANA
jgi:hypothetical protein